MMPDSLKALDLHRDPRFALQANPGPGTGHGRRRRTGQRAGERRSSDPARRRRAYAEEVEPPEPFHLFRTELTEVVRTYVEDEKYLVAPGLEARPALAHDQAHLGLTPTRWCPAACWSRPAPRG